VPTVRARDEIQDKGEEMNQGIYSISEAEYHADPCETLSWWQAQDSEHRQWMSEYAEQQDKLYNARNGQTGERKMNINDVYKSDYLKAGDLQGKKIKLTIARVEMAEFTDGSKKPVAYFTGKQKGAVLNKTNAMTVAAAFGPETDGWAGKEIVLYSAKVNFQGQMVDAIRVEPHISMTADDSGVPF
jgi:hypothetical protein